MDDIISLINANIKDLNFVVAKFKYEKGKLEIALSGENYFNVNKIVEATKIINSVLDVNFKPSDSYILDVYGEGR